MKEFTISHLITFLKGSLAFHTFLFIFLFIFLSNSNTQAQSEVPTVIDVNDPNQEYLIFNDYEFVENDILELDYTTTYPSRCQVSYQKKGTTQSLQEMSYFTDHISQLEISDISDDTIDFEIFCYVDDPRYLTQKQILYKGSAYRLEPSGEQIEEELEPPQEEDIEREDEIETPEKQDEEETQENDYVIPFLKITKQDIQKIREIVEESIAKFEESSKTYAAPTLLTSVMILAITSVSIYPYSIAYVAFHLFNANRKNSYGLVYDQATHSPVPFVVVEAYDLKGKFVKRAITSLNGKYTLVLDKGSYLLKVKQAPFNVYQKNIDVKSNEQPITDPIALAKSNEGENNFSNYIKRIFSIISKFVFIIGFLWAVFAFVVSPSVLFGLIIPIYLVPLISRFFTKVPRNWGFVYDENTRMRLEKIFVQIIDPKSSQIVDTQITDEKGRFGFGISKGQYKLIINSQEYKLSSQSRNVLKSMDLLYILYKVGKNKVEKIALSKVDKFDQSQNPF